MCKTKDEWRRQLLKREFRHASSRCISNIRRLFRTFKYSQPDDDAIKTARDIIESFYWKYTPLLRECEKEFGWSLEEIECYLDPNAPSYEEYKELWRKKREDFEEEILEEEEI